MDDSRNSKAIRLAALLVGCAGVFMVFGTFRQITPFELGALDVQRLLSTLVIFSILAAIVERCVEVLLLIWFRAEDKQWRAEKQALDADQRQLADLEAMRLANTINPEERLIVLRDGPGLARAENWGDLAEVAAKATHAELAAQARRAIWAGAFSLIVSGLIAAKGLLILNQILSASAAVVFESNGYFLWLDFTVTTLMLTGGAAWFHETIKSLRFS